MASGIPTPKGTPTPSTSTLAPTTPLTHKEIKRIALDLEKMAQNKSGTSPALYAQTLKDLRLGVVATEDVLRSTRIGVHVNRIKDEKVCGDVKVREQANALVRKWKNDIASGKGGRSPAPAGAKSNGVDAGRVKQEGEGKAEEKWRSVKRESRTVDTDGVDYRRTGQATRDNCVKLMYDGLAFMSEDPPTHILPIALSIEASAHANLGPETTSTYKSKIRSLFQNLKNKSASHLRESLLSVPPTLFPERFVSMPPEAMKSAERIKEDKEMEKENKKEAMVPQEDRAISSMLTCGGCGQKKVSYSQAQTRSADEPMTTFCTCTVCGRKWKFS